MHFISLLMRSFMSICRTWNVEYTFLTIGVLKYWYHLSHLQKCRALNKCFSMYYFVGHNTHQSNNYKNSNSSNDNHLRRCLVRARHCFPKDDRISHGYIHRSHQQGLYLEIRRHFLSYLNFSKSKILSFRFCQVSLPEQCHYFPSQYVRAPQLGLIFHLSLPLVIRLQAGSLKIT